MKKHYEEVFSDIVLLSIQDILTMSGEETGVPVAPDDPDILDPI